MLYSQSVTGGNEIMLSKVYAMAKAYAQNILTGLFSIRNSQNFNIYWIVTEDFLHSY